MDYNYTPLVSIIIPVFNGENYLREAIDSALCQTYENIEIIVINDGSTDDGQTRNIALSYEGKIRYYEKENGGCASALNYGISKMKGQWFSWLSHDDKYYPDKVRQSVEIIVNNGLESGNSIVYGNSDLIDEKGNRIFHPIPFRREGNYSPEAFFHSLLNDASLNGCALLIHKKVFEKVGGFDETLKYTLDFDCWLRIAIYGFGMYAFNRNLCSNRVHAQQVSVLSKDRKIPDLRKQIIKEIDLISSFDLSKVYYADLWMYAYTRRLKEEAKYISSAAADNGYDLSKLKRKGYFKLCKITFVNFVKYIYRAVFKKGMD